MLATTRNVSPDAPTVVTTNQVAYAVQAYLEQKSVAGVSGLDLDEPQTMVVSHETTKDGVERHLIQFNCVKQDTVDPTITGRISCHMVITVPPVVGTTALATAEVRKLSNFINASGIITAILNKEI